MRNFIAVSFVTLLLVLGSSQDPRTRFTPLNLSPMDWDPSTAIIPPTEQVEICSADDGVTADDQGTITKDLVLGQCLNVTSPNHPGDYPNSGRFSGLARGTYRCTMVITFPSTQQIRVKLPSSSFGMQEKTNGDCFLDVFQLNNIQISDDDDDADPAKNFCGKFEEDKTLLSDSGVDFVVNIFFVDDNVSGQGFLANLCVA